MRGRCREKPPAQAKLGLGTLEEHFCASVLLAGAARPSVSTNGILLNVRRITRLPLTRRYVLSLNEDGMNRSRLLPVACITLGSPSVSLGLPGAKMVTVWLIHGGPVAEHFLV